MDGVELISQERQRQIEIEGHTSKHDDENNCGGSLVLASVSYALDAVGTYAWDGVNNPSYYKKHAGYIWPWDVKWWKPTPNDPIRQLIKAGALIAAEIDRLQRKKA